LFILIIYIFVNLKTSDTIAKAITKIKGIVITKRKTETKVNVNVKSIKITSIKKNQRGAIKEY
jgi:hypothetical protein